MNDVEKIKELILNSNNVVFMGGAGVSTESSIPDFRSSEGLYNKNKLGIPPEKILNINYFLEHTEEFYNFYWSNMVYKDAKPNRVHNILARLEEKGCLKAIITQNIDMLHEKAGSKHIYHLHGMVDRYFCLDCGEFHDLNFVLNHLDSTSVPKCNNCGGILKPDVTLYGELLDSQVLRTSRKIIFDADVLLVGGTSLVVNPAANLINSYHRNKLIIINKESTPYDDRANIVIKDNLGDILENIIN